jgi:hypothetical protein
MHSCVERFPAPDAMTTETTPLDPADADAQIPLSEVVELERAQPLPTRDWDVGSVYGNSANNYGVRWGDCTSSYQPVTGLFGSADAITDYWRGVAGVKRWFRLVEEAGTPAADFMTFEVWAQSIRRAQSDVSAGFAYIVAAQLTQVRHSTQSALMDLLRRGSFPDDALFDLWVVPYSTHRLGACLVIPLVDIPYRALPHLVEPAEWKDILPRLLEHVKRTALGADVPLFPWNNPASDSKWGLEIDESLGGKSMISILGSKRAPI